MFMRSFGKLIVAFVLVGVMVYSPLRGALASRADDDAQILAWIQETNQRLAAQGFNVAVGQVELFTIGRGKPVYRLIHSVFRFVPSDPRRNADGSKIRYLVDSTADEPVRGDTTSGLTHTQTEAAIDRAMDSWRAQTCLHNVTLEKRSVPDGVDPDFIDSFLGYGQPRSQVHLFEADIVHAGWLPGFGIFSEPGVAAAAFTFYFISNGQPTDIDGDGYVDTAFVEIYYEDEYDWNINHDLPAIDVESIALHESGHALGLDHFGAPPIAVMNPFYGGLRQSPFPTDNAGLCAVWSSWP